MPRTARLLAVLLLLPALLGAAPGGDGLDVDAPARADVVREPVDTPRWTIFPSPDPAAVQSLLVLYPGGFVPSESYTDLVGALQVADPGLWVGVGRFVGDLTLPPEVTVRYAEIVAAASALGYPHAGGTNVVVAGHSLGGVMTSLSFSPAAVPEGLVLYGAYVPRIDPVPPAERYPIPVLTVAAEVDGRTRLPRMAVEVEGTRGLADRPVVVVAGANHASFADGADLSNDLPAERPLDALHAEIAALTTAFIAEHRSVGTVSPTAPVVLTAVAEADRLTRPFLAADRLDEARGCAAILEAGIEAATPGRSPVRVAVEEVRHVDPEAFAAARATQDGATVTVHSLVREEDRTGDQPTTPVSAAQIACKLVEPTAAIAAAGRPSVGPPATCADLNALTADRALAGQTEEARTRYLRDGARLLQAPDVIAPDAAAFAGARLQRTAPEDGVSRMTATAFVPGDGVAGERWCTLLPNARATELQMLDLLPRLTG